MAATVWIEGTTQSGKTDHLLTWLQRLADSEPRRHPTESVFLVFAANGDTRLALGDRIAAALPTAIPLTTTTPTAFFQDEVLLFWPLVVETLGLNPNFPMKLRPENEQELATQLWQKQLADDRLTVPGWTPLQTVRRSLDFLQLAAGAGVRPEDLGDRLRMGIPPGTAKAAVWDAIAAALLDWRQWCLDRGFLTYSLAIELYWRYLLPHPTYQDKFRQRFCGILADDADEYPAIFRQVLTLAQDSDLPTVLTWNPYGKVRFGLGADPDALATLRMAASEVVTLTVPTTDPFSPGWAIPIVESVLDPLAMPVESDRITSLQTVSRGQLLRKTAAAISDAIQHQGLAPGDIAVIGPGFDAIARYTLAEILQKQGIPVASLNDQRPLVSTPLVRAVLALIPFVYPGLGRMVERDAVAEMLVVLSQSAQSTPQQSWFDRTQIDPVRAELLVDHCFQPDPDLPQLLAVTEFPRWDRLGFQATNAYNALRAWIDQQRQAHQQRLITSPVNLIDRAIQTFLWRGNHLPYDQLAALRELMETAQHFWEVQGRLRQQQRLGDRPFEADMPPEARFLSLIYQGIVSANPFPVNPLEHGQQGVTLSTVFQYRSQRLTHRWQFWLDAGSPRWLTGTDTLYGYPLFLQAWDGLPWTIEQVEQHHEARLERILHDLLSRTRDRVILCHSELDVSGQEQTGPLLPWVTTVKPHEFLSAIDFTPEPMPS